MGWLASFVNVMKSVGKYIPMAWMGVKVLWSMYKAKVKQEGFRDALEAERNRRIELERRAALADRLDDTIAERVERIRRERAAAGKE